MTLDLTPALAPVFWAMAALLVVATAAIVLGRDGYNSHPRVGGSGVRAARARMRRGVEAKEKEKAAKKPKPADSPPSPEPPAPPTVAALPSR